MNEYKLIYEKDGEVQVLRYADDRRIPSDPNSRDWILYLKYVDNGGLTDPME